MTTILTVDAGAGTTTDISNVMDAANSLVKFAGDLFTTIVQNPILVLFVGASLVGIGLGIVKLLKRTAKS